MTQNEALLEARDRAAHKLAGVIRRLAHEESDIRQYREIMDALRSYSEAERRAEGEATA